MLTGPLPGCWRTPTPSGARCVHQGFAPRSAALAGSPVSPPPMGRGPLPLEPAPQGADPSTSLRVDERVSGSLVIRCPAPSVTRVTACAMLCYCSPGAPTLSSSTTDVRFRDTVTQTSVNASSFPTVTVTAAPARPSHRTAAPLGELLVSCPLSSGEDEPSRDFHCKRPRRLAGSAACPVLAEAAVPPRGPACPRFGFAISRPTC